MECLVSSCERSVQKSDSGCLSSLHLVWDALSPLLRRRQLPLPSAGRHQDSAAQICTVETAQIVLPCSSPHYCLEAGSLTEPSAVSARLISLWAFRIHLSLPPTHATVRNMPRFLGYTQIWAHVFIVAEQQCFSPLSHFLSPPMTFLQLSQKALL